METKKKQGSYLKKITVITVVIVLVTLFSVVLYSMGIRAENILMIYTFGILIIIIETKEYIYGVVSAFLMVALFNYFFTEPRFTLRVYDKNYLISFIIFLIVSIIVTSLTIKIQKQVPVSYTHLIPLSGKIQKIILLQLFTVNWWQVIK